MSVNKVILVGNLGADPEVRSFPNGGMIANVSVATTEKWSDKQTGERKEATEWHRVIFNNRLAEIAQQYLRKGSKVYIEGSIRTRKWQDQNGQDRYSTEVRAQQMQMLDSAAGMGGGYSPQGQSGNFENQGQGGYQNNNLNQNQASQQPFHNQAPQQPYQNQGSPQNNQMGNNGFGSPNQQTPPLAQQAPQPPVNPTAAAMSDAPVDDDIPF